jgi:Mrp family chromosome partitioning ATPase
MRTVLDRLASEVDLVVIDSPPLQAVTDSALLASIADSTLLVVDAGRTRRDPIHRAREALAQAGARVLGVTLNRVSERSGERHRYDYYGAYGTDHGRRRDEARVVTPVDKG